MNYCVYSLNNNNCKTQKCPNSNFYCTYHYNILKNGIKDVCSICLDDTEDLSICLITNCNHIFHEKCLMSIKKLECPNCKCEITNFTTNMQFVIIMNNEINKQPINLIQMMQQSINFIENSIHSSSLDILKQLKINVTLCLNQINQTTFDNLFLNVTNTNII